MENPTFEQSEQGAPEFSYDPDTGEASIELPHQSRIWLTEVILDDGEVLSTVTGVNEEDEQVIIELIGDSVDLEVIKVTIDGQLMYEVTKH